MADKTIRFRVDSKEVENQMRSLRSDTEQMAREMISDSEKGASNSREVIKNLQEEIKLRERGLKIRQDSEAAVLRQQKDAGKITEKEYSKGMSAVKEESNTDKLQTQILKDILDAIQKTSKDEIRSDKEGVINKLQQPGAPEDSMERLKRMIQRDEVGEEAGTPADGGRVQSQSRKGGGLPGINVMGGLQGAMAGDTAGALSGMGSLLTKAGPYALIAGGLAMFAGQIDKYEKSIKEYALVSGKTMEEGEDIKKTWKTKYGLKSDEMMGRQVSMSRAAGKDIGRDTAVSMMAASAATGVTDQQMQALMAAGRYNSGTNSPLQIVAGMEEFIKSTNRSIIQLPELIDTYLSTSNEILNRTGEVNDDNVRNIVGSIAKSYNVEGVNVQRMTSQLTGMASASQNPAMRAIQMQTIREMNPNMKSLDMLELMQDPTKDPKYMMKLMDTLKKVGGADMAPWVMMNMIPGASVKDVKKYMSGELKIEDLTPKKSEDLMKTEFDQRAKDFTGNIETVSGKLDEVKNAIVGGATDVVNAVVKFGSKVLGGTPPAGSPPAAKPKGKS